MSQRALQTVVAIAAMTAGWSLFRVTPAHAQTKVPEVYAKTPPIEGGHAPKMRATEVKATGRVFKVANSTGDEVMSGLYDMAEKNKITNGEISGLGGFSSAVLSMYNPEKNGFQTLVVDQKCEVSAFTGTIGTQGGKPTVHAHVVLGCVDGTTRSGHLIEGHVNPVMDLFVKEYVAADSTSK